MQRVVKALFKGHVSKAAFLIVRLEFGNFFCLRMKSIKVGKDHVAFHLAGATDTHMVRVGIHAEDFLLNRFRRVREVDDVVKRLRIYVEDKKVKAVTFCQ